MKKNTFNSIKQKSFLLLALVVGSLYACKEEDPTAPLEAKAAPVIEAIRTTNPDKADSTFTQSTLGSTIVIKGQNLAEAQYVSFNGQKASLNPVYASNNYLIIRIPEQTPTVATASSVPDELKVGNSKGEATYKFKVLPPAPVVQAISNESAKPGQTITLYGQYFYFVKDVTFPGGVKGTNVSAAANGLSLNVTVPAGVDPTKGDVIVTSESGRSVASAKTKLYSYGMVGNFDDKNPFGWGIPAAANITTSAPGITALDGKFGLISMALPGNWGWANEKVINLADYSGGQIFPTEPASHYNANDPIANYEARMEVAVSNTDLKGLQLQVMTQEATDKELTANVNLADFVRSTDGKWYTVAVPLANLANGSTKLAKYGDFLKGNKTGIRHYRAVIVNTNAADVPATIAIDNMRIVNITK
ncbi:glycan-binding surface protein [Adhaeribacter aquaticus]|uniref:glycan-binding surface protein n=1 Tax=Adhaeribacter aquaticus TaxID=299567 RepID=UPI0003FFEF32|nr:glycan-binding surface protein [Adhaeribacter aquaticus]